MAEDLTDIQRYAVAGIMGLALNESHRHSRGKCACRTAVEEEEEDDEAEANAWIEANSLLFTHIFRYVGVDSKAWPGLIRTAASGDTELHLSAFLKILSEGEEEEKEAKEEGEEEEDDEGFGGFESLDCDGEENSPYDLGKGDEKWASGSRRCHEDPEGGSRGAKASTAEVEEQIAPGQDRTAAAATSPLLDTSAAAPVSARKVGDGESGDNVMRNEDNGNGARDDGATVGPQLPLQHEANRPADDDGQRDQGEGSQDGSDLSASTSSTTTAATETSNSVARSGPPRMRLRLPPGLRKIDVLFELVQACVVDDLLEDSSEKVLTPGYDARERVALRLVAAWFGVPWKKVASLEMMVARQAREAEKEREKAGTTGGLETTADTKRLSRWKKWQRNAVIGAAALGGGALLAVTGGLAAPAIGAGIAAFTTGSIAAAAAATSTAVGSAAVAGAFGAAGAGLTGYRMARRTGGVSEFFFQPLGDNHGQGCLAVTILVSGLINEPEDFVHPWEGPDGDAERFALIWETEHLMAVSTALCDWMATQFANELVTRGAALTVLHALVAAIALPSALLSLTSMIDNRWAMVLDRADKAGIVLADLLLKRKHGDRPVTLVGFSLGARLIFSCLEELVRRGNSAGIVERVVLLGGPIPIEVKRWQTVREIVAGRFVNGFSENDWNLGIVYRTSILMHNLAGVAKVKVRGVENIDLTGLVKGHSSYLKELPQIFNTIDMDNPFPLSEFSPNSK